MATNPRAVSDETLLIAAEVRRQRGKLGMEQRELAQRADIPQGTLSRIENGRTAIDAEQITRLARAFDMLPEQLWASARQGADPKRVYPAEGRPKSANTKFFEPSDDHIEELLARRRNDNAG